jgi:hypothetical protein
MLANPSASASTNPDFQLQSLGWKSFQDLCLTILGDQLGQAVQRYSPVRDGGRDGAFSGKWTPQPGLRLSGTTIVQCKFTNRSNRSLTSSAFRDELQKARVLWRRYKRDNYILLTNYSVTAEFEEEYRRKFKRFGCSTFHVFGYDWIAGAIQQSARLRTLVPRLYGLGDLSQILDERWYAQTLKLLEAERENLRKFVPTNSYRQAVDALNGHGFVLLLGEPAVGKTAIAATLTLASGDAWNCRPMKLERASELRERWNPEDPKQLFWIDDAFGETQYHSLRAHQWNSVFPWLHAVLSSGAKIILTSRDYIYARARGDLKQIAFPLIRESQVVVDVSNLKTDEKEQILYNHIRLGDQSRPWRKRFKQFFDVAAQHERFLPEIARRLGQQAFTKNLTLTAENISDFIQKPEEFLRDTLEGMSADDRSALALIFLRGGSVQSPVDLDRTEVEIISRIGGTLHGLVLSLNAMRGGFVKLNDEHWMYKHPTIGDAFAAMIADNPELVDLYISGARMNKLLNEITCGPVELQGVQLIVTSSRFDIMIRRLQEYRNLQDGDLEKSWARRRHCDAFLANRCSKQFLQSYIERTSGFWESLLGFGSYLSAISKFDLILTLKRLSLLSAEQHSVIKKRVMYLATETPDSDFLSTSQIRSFFSENEIVEIMNHVKQVLIPRLAETLSDWENNYSRSDGDTESYYSPLKEALESFRAYFNGDIEAQRSLSRSITKVEQLIAEYDNSDEEGEGTAYDFNRPTPVNKSVEDVQPRRIFDDLDA